MSTVISVENLGKKYTISHQQRGDNSSLREVINNRVANFGKKLFSPFTVFSSPLTIHHSQSSNHHSPASEDFWALKDVSFEVKQGERIGIIGRNGAGKSTLLKILSRITEPTTGRVKIKGRVASLLEVGTGFHPELTGRENIYLNGAILGMGRQEISRKFDEIVAFSEIEKFLDTPVKRYSSGMYVRLAFAVAAHLEPEILIVDEVLAVGDAAFQKKCLGKMEDVGREGRTVLFVSHNMQAITRICNRVAWLDYGELIDDGSALSVVHSYLENTESVQKTAEMDLTSWSQRYGSGESKILSARLLNNSGAISKIFFRNSSMIVEFSFASKTSQVLHFSAVVISETGVKLLHMCHHDGNVFQSESFEGKHIVRLEIPKLPLCAGSYKMVLAIHTDRMQPLDVVMDVLPFMAEDDVATPRPYRTVAEYGYCWTPNHWSIKKAD